MHACGFVHVRYAATVGAAHIYTSAKLNKGLDETFTELATRASPTADRLPAACLRLTRLWACA